MAAVCFFIRFIKIGIANRTGDGESAQYPACAYGLGDICHRADMGDRDANPFYLFGYRCAATSAGASRRCEDCRLNVFFPESCGYLLAFSF